MVNQNFSNFKIAFFHTRDVKYKIMKTILLILSIQFVVLNLDAQSLKEVTKVLKKVKRLDKIDQLKEKYPDWTIFEATTLLTDSIKFPEITRGKSGDIITKQTFSTAPTYAMKFITIHDEELCKVKYIYLDGSKLSKTTIDSIRTIIIQRFKKGETFENLVTEYTMLNDKTGDLKWFHKGVMVEEFDSEVRPRRKNEIFTVDVERKNWYYVVFKNHNNKTVKAVKGISIKYSM